MTSTVLRVCRLDTERSYKITTEEFSTLKDLNRLLINSLTELYTFNTFSVRLKISTRLKRMTIFFYVGFFYV